MKKLLLVENEKSEINRISSVLCNYEYNVKRVGSSAEGLDYIKESHPDLLIIDLEENEKLALSLISDTAKKSPRTSILVLVSSLETDATIKSLECGADAFIHKPIDEGSLSAYLDKRPAQMAM
ncbi:hypothetical protein A9Q84_10755 [Halobacteriovorax marinus]|uniref:Response regulatory domain-containing protein n=1 Tax=Halobacteriovorax marinus TaxID=97084 RepID=A0A1Y5FDY3_9BACT|nr:hypothetical protein A9Q84_10755 [Halobacteriovorax marinus]